MSLNRNEVYDKLDSEYKSYLLNVACSYRLQHSLMTLSRHVFELVDIMNWRLPDVSVENIIILHTNEPVCVVFITYENIQKFGIHCGMKTLEIFQNERLLDTPEGLDVAYRIFREKAQMPEEVVFQLGTLLSSFEETKEPFSLPSCVVETVSHWYFREPDWAIQDDREWENG